MKSKEDKKKLSESEIKKRKNKKYGKHWKNGREQKNK